MALILLKSISSPDTSSYIHVPYPVSDHVKKSALALKPVLCSSKSWPYSIPGTPVSVPSLQAKLLLTTLRSCAKRPEITNEVNPLQIVLSVEMKGIFALRIDIYRLDKGATFEYHPKKTEASLNRDGPSNSDEPSLKVGVGTEPFEINAQPHRRRLQHKNLRVCLRMAREDVHRRIIRSSRRIWCLCEITCGYIVYIYICGTRQLFQSLAQTTLQRLCSGPQTGPGTGRLSSCAFS